MPSLDDRIDALYQLPPGEFIGARNQLARQAGSRAAEVRALAKPTAAAWAVNQLYWRKRGVFDALARASEASRQAQVRQLGGAKVETTAAEAAHRRALDKAVEVAAALLREAGDAVSPATVHAMTRTLEAVPSPEVQGRLVKPIEPIGFGLLAGLLGPSGVTSGRPAEVVVMNRGRRAHQSSDAPAVGRGSAAAEAQAVNRESARERQAAEARKRDRERLQRELADAEQQERDASAALDRLTRAVEHAERRVRELQAEVHDAEMRLSTRREEAEQAKRQVNAATRARVKAERKLGDLEGDVSR